MNINQANELVKKLVGEDDFHDVEDILASYYDIAQTMIATTVCPIEKTFELKAGVKTELPKDLYRLVNVPAGYKRVDKNNIIVNGSDNVVATYYAYPKKLYDDTPQDTEFEVEAEAQSAIAYYAAAQTVLADSDMRRYYAFMETYNGLLSNILASSKEKTVFRVVTQEEMK